MAIIEERTGDIFHSPPHSILIHACNTKGSWGNGVAAAFKNYSPSAYNHQHHHCTSPPPSTSLAIHQRNLVGTCLLIPPFPSLPDPKTKPAAAQKEKKFWIACLFTSHGYGKSVDTAEAILDATRRAVEDLGRQVREYKEVRNGEGEGREEMAGCVSVRINSGLFGVDWERTKKVLEDGGVDMVVVGPEDEQGKGNEKGSMKKGNGEGQSIKGMKRKAGEKNVGEDTLGGKRQTRLKFGNTR